MRRIKKYNTHLLMLVPGLLLMFVFRYGPLYGVLLAFKEYRLIDGVLGSPWVGFEQFRILFNTPKALNAIKNTIIISLLKMLWGFPAPILFALMLNEVSHRFFKRLVQSLSYLPHFISWIILSGIFIQFLSPTTGPINLLIHRLGGEPIFFMASVRWFRTVLVATAIYKGFGWGSILYLAALSNIDPTLYESAVIDGANRFQRIVYITLPMLVPLIVIVLILQMRGIMEAGFDQVFNMYNPRVYPVADIIGTYVYRTGIVQMNYSFATAVDVFQSTVGLMFILIVNFATRRIGNTEYGLW